MVYVHVQTYGYAQYFGPKPQLVHCPTCNQNTKTTIKYVNGKNTWSESIAIGLFGLFVCICGIVLVIINITDTTKDDRVSRVIASFIVLIIGLVICGLSFIPFHWDSCKDVKHYCSVCNNYVGKYIRDHRRPIVILPPELYKHKVYQPKNNV
uniref:LITAF domain-containing protein n=1 Tax=Meloidogyne incognita TaxID=6306 RepID=A0A914LHR4_MELIC